MLWNSLKRWWLHMTYLLHLHPAGVLPVLWITYIGAVSMYQLWVLSVSPISVRYFNLYARLKFSSFRSELYNSAIQCLAYIYIEQITSPVTCGHSRKPTFVVLYINIDRLFQLALTELIAALITGAECFRIQHLSLLPVRAIKTCAVSTLIRVLLSFRRSD